MNNTYSFFMQAKFTILRKIN